MCVFEKLSELTVALWCQTNVSIVMNFTVKLEVPLRHIFFCLCLQNNGVGLTQIQTFHGMSLSKTKR